MLSGTSSPFKLIFARVMNENVPIYLIVYGGAAFPISELFRARGECRSMTR
jgi:hypothetical protein